MKFAALILALAASPTFAASPSSLPVVEDYYVTSYGLRYSGPPKVNPGRYASDAIIVEQPLAYAQTVELEAPVTAWDVLMPHRLDKGTRLYFTTYGQWCTYRKVNAAEVCLRSEKGQWSWHQPYEGLDLTYPFRYVYAICCTWESPEQFQTIMPIAPPVMKTVVDDRTVMTAVIELKSPKPGPDALAINAYCVPADNPEGRWTCGRSPSVDSLRREDYIYTANDNRSIRIHLDQADRSYVVSIHSGGDDAGAKK